jgi:hypothetical protein
MTQVRVTPCVLGQGYARVRVQVGIDVPVKNRTPTRGFTGFCSKTKNIKIRSRPVYTAGFFVTINCSLTFYVYYKLLIVKIG